MNKKTSPITTATATTSRRTWAPRSLIVWLLSAALTGVIGCGTAKSTKKKDDFFTSGSREADQRASQRMAKDEQLAGSGARWDGPGQRQSLQPQPSQPDP